MTTIFEYDGKTYTFSNEDIQVGDETFPISRGKIMTDEYVHDRYDFRYFMCGFPDEPHIMIDPQYSDYKPFQARTNFGFGPIEQYYKIVKIEDNQ